jgi:hypothetical protein
MSKPIVLTHSQWEKLKNRLTNDYSPSVMMISWRMKDKLGFTIREYQAWREVGSSWNSTSDIRLDFYNEPKRLMFLLKYSEYLDKSGKNSY